MASPPAHPTGTDRLDRYRAKRDFTVTAEPSGSGPPATGGHRFVVQRHRATRLHYDLRLEAAGVLLSWAVPKGPTLDPAARRLAVQVEDHPLDYYDFEGAIPRGEYGGGDVVVWDWGTWDLAEADDPLDAVESGNIHFDLHGEKLRGRFVLVRRGRGGAARSAKPEWLLLHKHDDEAVAGWDPEDYPRSVKTGRTNDEVKAVAQDLMDRGEFDHTDIGVLILQITDELPSEDDVDRVRERLAAKGWPLDDPRDATDDAGDSV